MIAFLSIILLLQLVAVIAVNIQLRKIIMNQADLATALNNFGTQLEKALSELIAAIQNAGNTTPEVDAAVQRLQGVAQQLDDIVPDAPPPGP